MGTWHTNNFAGGMNDYLHPSLLDANTAALLRDAGVDNGKLTPIPGMTEVSGATPESLGHYGTKDRSVVKWNGLHYWSDNTAASYGIHDPDWGGAGHPWTPEEGDAIGVPFVVYSGTDGIVPTFTVAPDANGLPAGTYRYCITLVNHHGWEGAPGSLDSYYKEIVLSAASSVTVTLPASGVPANVAYAKVYRTIDHGADYYNVGQITRGANGWVAYVDTLSDSLALMSAPLDTEDNYPPPSAGRFLTEYAGVFFLAVGDRLYFSRQGNPNAWPTLNFITFPDAITGIAPEFNGILVFTMNNAWRVVGADSQETIQQTLIPGNQGCVNWRSVSVLSNAPIWLSNDGLCTWDGQSVSLISYRRLVIGAVKPHIVCAVCRDDKYYLFTARSDTAPKWEGGAYVFDTRAGGLFYKLSYLGVEYAWYDADRDDLYAVKQRKVWRFGTDTAHPLSWHYRSPLVGGTQLRKRHYDEIVVNSPKLTTLRVYVEGSLIFGVYVPAGRQRVKLPLKATGTDLQFTLDGTGELTEVAVLYGGD